jgi:hypothetical protein
MAKRSKSKPSWLHKMGDDLVEAVLASFAEAGATPPHLGLEGLAD